MFVRIGLAALALLCVLIVPAAAKKPSSDLLGLRIDMPMGDAVRRLERMGHIASGQSTSERKQYWEITDKRYANVVARFDGKDRLQWVSAFARRDGKRVRFEDIGDMKRARKAGEYIYVWQVPARGERPGFQWIARSLDPKIVESVSLTRLGKPNPSAAIVAPDTLK